MAIYIGLGSNLGDRRANLRLALRLLEPLVHAEAVSALYESPPQPPAPPPDYLNAAARIATDLTPALLLQHLKQIEALLGRHDLTHWSPRPIDLDILFYDDLVIDSETLTIPHPRIVERAFVLQPLLDLDPNLVHLMTKEPLATLLSRISNDGLMRIAEPGWQAAKASAEA